MISKLTFDVFFVGGPEKYFAHPTITKISISPKFHRFHRWLFMFNPFWVETNPNGVKCE